MESAGLKLAYLLIQPFEGANWRSAIRVVFPSKELSYSRLCRWIPVADGKKESLTWVPVTIPFHSLGERLQKGGRAWESFP